MNPLFIRAHFSLFLMPKNILIGLFGWGVFAFYGNRYPDHLMFPVAWVLSFLGITYFLRQGKISTVYEIDDEGVTLLRTHPTALKKRILFVDVKEVTLERTFRHYLCGLGNVTLMTSSHSSASSSWFSQNRTPGLCLEDIKEYAQIETVLQKKVRDVKSAGEKR